jgi:hypothetical protein
MTQTPVPGGDKERYPRAGFAEGKYKPGAKRMGQKPPAAGLCHEKLPISPVEWCGT